MSEARGDRDGGGAPAPGGSRPHDCELCEAAPITQRFYEDDLCWVAECEACNVPMVVWKAHDPDPPAEVRVVLLERLAHVVDEHYGYEYFIDDHMRTIPHHYHAHARRRGGWMGHSSRR